MMERPPSLPVLAVSGVFGLAGLWLAVTGAIGAGAKDDLAGPVGAQVVRVVDGDTLVVRAHIWLGQEVQTLVRLSGIDAPELRGGCRTERDLPQRARAHLANHLAAADGHWAHVRLYDIRVDKFGGRVLARVVTDDGGDLGQGLVAAGLARPYGGQGRGSWCAPAASG
jgi:endonuclease YncB( thermonuclease family)